MYLLAVAALSPCPPLLGNPAGIALVVGGLWYIQVNVSALFVCVPVGESVAPTHGSLTWW